MTSNSDMIKYIARAGYGAKATVYIILGGLIVISALTAFQARTPSKKNVFQEIAQQPFGQFLLAAVILGLICYALWRWIQAFKNTEGLDMGKFKHVVKRISYVISGIIYALVAYLAYKVWQGTEQSGNQEKSESISAQLMQNEWGVWLVGAIGVIILIFSLLQFKKAYKVDFMDKVQRGKMSQKEISACEKAGRLGYGARGVVYILIGSFFVQAAITHNPKQAGGLEQALSTIIQQPYGPWLLAAVGAGLALYGVFCGFETFYRQTHQT